MKQAFLGMIIVISAVSFTATSWSGQTSYDMPAKPDPLSKYFIFLHNYYVETAGPDGACKYYDILKTFAEKGYTVISEVRTGSIVPREYAEKPAGWVKKLLDSGVPPENIMVGGHSKGGVIALWVASKLQNPKVGFVIMAGCEISPLGNAYPDLKTLKGRMLSIYAASDSVAGSCEKAFSTAAGGLFAKEIKLESDAGHRLFFVPDRLWIDPVTEWMAK